MYNEWQLKNSSYTPEWRKAAQEYNQRILALVEKIGDSKEAIARLEFADGQEDWGIEQVEEYLLSFVSSEDSSTLARFGFTPIERELVKIDGEVQPSDMVLCEKDGKRVRVRLEPGSDHLTGTYYDDARN